MDEIKKCMHLSIIILNYKSKNLVRNCLRAIFESRLDFEFEVIVADNNSDDGVRSMLETEFSQVKFFSAGENRGMGAGNNFAVNRATGKYVLIVNPDIFVFPESIGKLITFAEKNESVGVVAPQLLNPDRTLQHTCYRWHNILTPLYRRTFLGKYEFAKKEVERFLMLDKNHEEQLEPDWIQGSCLLIPKKVYDQVGGFDEKFFMYFEDTDLCRRIRKENYKIVYFPEAKVIHLHRKQSGGGFSQLLFNKLMREHIKSFVKYWWKWR